MASLDGCGFPVGCAFVFIFVFLRSLNLIGLISVKFTALGARIHNRSRKGEAVSCSRELKASE